MRLPFTAIVSGVLMVSCSNFTKCKRVMDYDYKLRMAEKYYLAKKYNFAQQLK